MKLIFIDSIIVTLFNKNQNKYFASTPRPIRNCKTRMMTWPSYLTAGFVLPSVVIVIDTAANIVVATVSVVTDPNNIAVSPDGAKVYGRIRSRRGRRQGPVTRTLSFRSSALSSSGIRNMT